MRLLGVLEVSAVCSCGSQVRELVRHSRRYKSKRVYCPGCGAALLMYAGAPNPLLVDEYWAQQHGARVIAYRAAPLPGAGRAAPEGSSSV